MTTSRFRRYLDNALMVIVLAAALWVLMTKLVDIGGNTFKETTSVINTRGA